MEQGVPEKCSIEERDLTRRGIRNVVQRKKNKF